MSQQRRRHLSLRHSPPWRVTSACLASGRDENLSPSPSQTAERRPEGENCTETETRRSATRRERAVGGDDRRRSKKKTIAVALPSFLSPCRSSSNVLLTQSSSEAATARSTDRYASACSLRSVSFWAGAMTLGRFLLLSLLEPFTRLSGSYAGVADSASCERARKGERADERRLDTG